MTFMWLSCPRYMELPFYVLMRTAFVLDQAIELGPLTNCGPWQGY